MELNLKYIFIPVACIVIDACNRKLVARITVVTVKREQFYPQWSEQGTTESDETRPIIFTVLWSRSRRYANVYLYKLLVSDQQPSHSHGRLSSPAHAARHLNTTTFLTVKNRRAQSSSGRR